MVGGVQFCEWILLKFKLVHILNPVHTPVPFSHDPQGKAVLARQGLIINGVGQKHLAANDIFKAEIFLAVTQTRTVAVNVHL